MKQAEITRLLPEIFQRVAHPGSPLFTLLAVMEALHEPSEEVLQNLSAYFNPYRTPSRFVPLLASWVDLELLLSSNRQGETPPPFPSGTGRLRELVAAAPYLSSWRGTAKGLLRFLETATGLKGFEIEEQTGEDGQPLPPFELLIRAPAEAEVYRGLVQRIIELEKPAYVTYELRFKSAPKPAPLPAVPPVPPPAPIRPSPPPPVFRPRLENPATGHIFIVPPGIPLVGLFDPATGNRPEIDLTGEDTTKTVALQHARFLFDKGNFLLVALPNPTTGTFINGKPVTAQSPTLIREGDRVTFGRLEMIFRIG
jgi:phage tail-like protein